MPNHRHNRQLISLILLAFTTHSRVALASDTYEVHDLLKVCPTANSKLEMALQSMKATIFKLDLPNGLPPAYGDFLCHLELEAPSSAYGFHVYFDEMNLHGEESSPDGCSSDYIQFARDKGFLTTFKSPRYCGTRRKVNANDSNDVHRSYRGDQIRLYVEQSDYEMDFWIKVDGGHLAGLARNLTVVVTIFRKHCSNDDNYYRKCKHTDYCIRNELFCDSVINCAWPNGDVPTDEQLCHLGDKGSLPPANIPIIIIVIIVVLGILVVFSVALKTFCKSIKGPVSRLNSRQDQERSRSSGAVREVPLLLQNDQTPSSGPPSAPPDSSQFVMDFPPAPPTYEEAVARHKAQSLSQNQQPPPYSAT